MKKNDVFLPLKTKAELLYGDGFWVVRGVKELNYKPFMVTDGPHGLRKEIKSDQEIAFANSQPATSFPTSSLVACSFDKDLLFKMGEAIAKEALDQEVSVVLGPGINLKRNPLCGRNFEYYSEDPLLSGKLGANFILGVQSLGVGTSLKHFAANNQETYRLKINAVIDEVALYELYLKGFEIAIKEGKPYTVMCAYNKVNNIYASENKFLLIETLRDRWQFDGIVVSDWGAINDIYLARINGLDLEMPGIGERYKDILKGVKKGCLKEEDINKRVINLLLLHHRLANLDFKVKVNYEEHFELAKKVASESFVLVKNNGVLPLKDLQKTAIIGAFAKYPRYQGTGSSKVNPYKLRSFLDALDEEKLSYQFALGYDIYKDKINQTLLQEALSLANEKDNILLFVGLPDAYESEGFDRAHMSLPLNQLSLINELIKLKKKIIIIFQGGAPVELPFINQIDAMLLTYLGGVSGGHATKDILLGKVNPSGKLAETWPLKYEDVSSASSFPGDDVNVLYKESLYVGYRYFDKAKVKVNFPFGYGLSYTTFDYQNFVVKENKGIIDLSFDLSNTGQFNGKEVVQLYVSYDDLDFRPIKELKAFEKIALDVNETKKVTLTLKEEDLKIYDVKQKTFVFPGGKISVHVGSSSQDLHFTHTLTFKKNEITTLDVPKSYQSLKHPFNVSDQEFAKLFKDEVLPLAIKAIKPYTLNSTLRDIKHTLIGKIIYKKTLDMIEKMDVEDEATKRMFLESALTLPLRGYVMSGFLTHNNIKGIVALANRRLFSGLFYFIKK